MAPSLGLYPSTMFNTKTAIRCSLTDSEDESEDEDYNANGESSDDDEDEDGIVPDGYLSEDEGDAMECEPKKEKKQKEKSSSKEKSGKRVSFTCFYFIYCLFVEQTRANCPHCHPTQLSKV